MDGFRFDLASILVARLVRPRRCPTRRCCGTSSPTRRWRARSSSPRRGTRPGCTRSAASSATVGRSGTAASATTPAASSAATPARVRRFADRLVGSPEIYGHKQREPEQSINFVTCHDGFTLNDLVSYDRKHNEANGEDNRDGGNDNFSWNCGVEGPTDDPAIEALRNRQVKNFLDRHAAVDRRAHDPDGRRGPPHAERQQQRLLPRRRDRTGSTGRCSRSTPTCTASSSCSARGGCCARSSTSGSASRLNQLIQQANKAWHGVKLDQPDWGDAFAQHRVHGRASARKGSSST